MNHLPGAGAQLPLIPLSMFICILGVSACEIATGSAFKNTKIVI